MARFPESTARRDLISTRLWHVSPAIEPAQGQNPATPTTSAPPAVPVNGSTVNLTRWAWLAIAAALITISLKTGAFALTGSVGLLSDAAESVVNLVAAVIALVALTVAARPADSEHHFGHGKAEYFSAGVEGVLIFVAAAVIVFEAAKRLLDPLPLESIGLGLAISFVATAVNLVVGQALIRAGRAHRSPTLQADGKHLMTDVWTSVGVLVGVLAVGLTGWWRLDPVVAILVAVNILFTGWKLVASSVQGLMDRSLSDEDHNSITAVLDKFTNAEIGFHGLATRESGRHRFMSVHVLVPGAWTVSRGHDVLEDLESSLREKLPGIDIHTHMEPREDHRAYGDYVGGHTWAGRVDR